MPQVRRAGRRRFCLAAAALAASPMVAMFTTPLVMLVAPSRMPVTGLATTPINPCCHVHVNTRSRHLRQQPTHLAETLEEPTYAFPLCSLIRGGEQPRQPGCHPMCDVTTACQQTLRHVVRAVGCSACLALSHVTIVQGQQRSGARHAAHDAGGRHAHTAGSVAQEAERPVGEALAKVLSANKPTTGECVSA